MPDFLLPPTTLAFLRAWSYPLLSFVLILGFGLWFTFVIPPFQAPDEQNHFARAYSIVDGYLVTPKSAQARYGYQLPGPVADFSTDYNLRIDQGNNNVHSLNQKYAAVHFNDVIKRPKKEIDFENTAVYSPVSYAPQVAGLAIAEQANLSLLDGFNLARSFALLAFLSVVLASYLLLPRKTWPILFVLSALPSVVQQAASFSADSFTNSVMLLFVAVLIHYALALRLPKDKDNWPALLALAAPLALLALCKQLYVLFGLLLFVFVGSRLVKSPIKRYAALGAIVAGAAYLSVLWNAQVADVGLHYATIQGRHDIDPIGQLLLIIKAPLDYVGVLANTFLYDFSNTNQLWIAGFVGRLAAKGPILPLVFQILAWGAIALALLGTAGRKAKELFVNTRQLALTALVGAATFLGVVTVLYMTYTEVGLDYVKGLQGRYLIPISFLLLIAALWVKVPRITIRPVRVQLAIVFIATLNLWIMATAAGTYFLS